MVLKMTAQKENPKQSLAKVTSEAAICRCSSEWMLIEIFAIFTGKHVLESFLK